MLAYSNSYNSPFIQGNEDSLEGAIAVQPLVSQIQGFDNYFTKLTLEHSAVNPWFDEFWEKHFKYTFS